jgi:hypothetical protein
MRSSEEIEALLDKVEGLIKSYEDADNEYQTNQRRENWKNKFGERFAPYTDKIKLLNGDDFDLMEESRKEYEDQYSDLTDDEYCNALENNIKATLQRIWPEAEPEQIEEATQEIAENASPEGDEGLTETHIEAEDKDGDGEISEDEVETHTVSEKSDEEDKPEEEEESEEEESDPVEDFRKELEEEKAKMPKRGE